MSVVVITKYEEDGTTVVTEFDTKPKPAKKTKKVKEVLDEDHKVEEEIKATKTSS